MATQQRLTMLYLGNDGKLHSWTGITITPPPAPPPAVGSPTARITVTNQTGLTITVSGTSSTEGTTGAVLTGYAWDLGDGTTVAGPTATHTYAKPGTYTVKLTVTDSLYATSTTTITPAIVAPDIPPTISIAASPTSADGLTWQFTLTVGDVDGTVQRIAIGYGDGGAVDTDTSVGGLQLNWSHTYAAGGTYTAGATAYDDAGGVTTVYKAITVTQYVVAQPPVAAISLSETGMNVAYTMAGSRDPNGDTLSYDVDWGDGSPHSSGVTNSHTYATIGPWTVTGTATDTHGLSSSVTALATPTQPSSGSTAVRSPWVAGSPTQGLPSGVRVVNASSLLTHGQTMNLQTLVSKLTAPSVINIDGEDVAITSWAGNVAVQGNSNFLGLVGTVSNGSFNNQVRLVPGIMNASTVSAQAAQAKWANTLAMAYNVGGGVTQYWMGVHLVGADQPRETDTGSGWQVQTIPARSFGFNFGTMGPGSIIQNCLLDCWNTANGSSPPFEVGQANFRRTALDGNGKGVLLRRVESNGIMPVGSASRPLSSTADPYGLGWRRSGGWQHSADSNMTLQDFSIHDGLVSGLTFSYAGTATNSLGPSGGNSGNITINNLYVDNQSKFGFSGVNLEGTLGFHHFDHPTINMQSGGQHMRINPKIASPYAPNITDFRVTEPTWSGGPDARMFAIGIAGWGVQQTTAPTVIKNGVQLTPTTTKGLDPARYYLIVAM